MQEKPKNRDWVKNAAIIFLAVLLVLTFFSNTIMNRSLPEVATQEVTSGSIVARVRGTGTVTANSNTQVKMEKTRVIRSVLVKVGQQVEAGDVLFTLGEGSSEEIEAAETALRNLQASYNRTAASMPYHDYTTEERKIRLLEEQLNEAKENLRIAENAAKSSTPYAEQIASVEAELEKAIKIRDAAKKEYDEARGTGEDVNVKSIQWFVDYDRKSDQTLDLTFKPLDTYLNINADQMSVMELDNFQAAILRILVEEEMIDGDLLVDDYSDRTRIDIQKDRVKTQIDNQTCLIRFYNDDGTLLQSSQEPYDSVPYYKDGVPTKPDDTLYTYTFQRWDPFIEAVSGPADYTAVYQKNLKPTPSPETTTPPAEETTPPAEETTPPAEETTPPAEETTPPAEETTPPAEEATPPIEKTTNSSDSSESFRLSVISSPEPTYDSDTYGFDNSYASPASADALLTEPVNELHDAAGSNDKKDGEQDSLEDEAVPTSPATGEESREELLKWKDALEAALKLYDKAESKKYLKEQIVNQKLAIYEAAKADAEKWSLALQTYLDSGSAESAVYKSKLAAYKAAEDAYLTAKENLNEQKNYDQRSDTGTFIDLSNTQADIEVARKKLADLTGGEEAQILARVAGTIQTIDCSPGDTKKKDDILCTIEAPDMGYSLSFSVTNDQANRLRIGDTATVSNFYWGTEITATLNSIKIDPKNPQSNKLLTFDLSGNVTAGSELTLSVGQKSANYDIIIPSSAIRTDANGSFVLKVEAKNSPLGNRYTARRVPVEILASDDSNSAVSADLGFGDYVITTSSVPIKNGELVRLATA